MRPDGPRPATALETAAPVPASIPGRPAGDGAADALRVLIAAANCSLRWGGEAALPYHYFRLLLRRGVEVDLVTHGRNRAELEAAFPDDRGRLHFVPDDLLRRMLWAMGRRMPSDVDRATFGFVGSLYEQYRLRRVVRRLVRERGIDVVHQPYPVSPAEPSMIYGVGAPVVIGPLNGGRSYPPAFLGRQGRFERAAIAIGRRLRHAVNRLIPGKLRAQLVLVANPRTARHLPRGLRGMVVELVENGVDLATWNPHGRAGGRPDGPVCFAYVGRLVDWKGVDLLLEAWASLRRSPRPRLVIVGDGPMRRPLEGQCERLGLGDVVEFAGWLSQRQCAARLHEVDAMILPSLNESGGAAILEAMAMGLPIIATAWGGPLDYLDDSCGILVPPDAPGAFVAGLAAAVDRLAGSADLRRRMGRAGRLKAIREFDWDAKVNRVMGLYLRAARPPGDGRRDNRQPDTGPVP